MSSVEHICSPISQEELIRIRAVADFQFGRGCGSLLFPEIVSVIRSKKTGKVKNIYYRNQLLATLRPKDGYLALSLEGAKRLTSIIPPPKYRVLPREDVIDFLKKGRNLFAKHVIDCDPEIRPGEEVIVSDQEGNIIAVGKAVLAGFEMKRFKNGVAVKIRKGEGAENEED
ncbi:MAG: PUA domain-containing protein [Candidatus Methanomethylicaceae archaeon]